MPPKGGTQEAGRVGLIRGLTLRTGAKVQPAGDSTRGGGGQAGRLVGNSAAEGLPHGGVMGAQSRDQVSVSIQADQHQR